MLNNPNPPLSKARLTSLNLSHFKMVEAMGLIKINHIEVPLNGITFLPNFMKIYQVVKNISIDPLYLKPVMPLDHFHPTVNNVVTMVALVTMVTSAKDVLRFEFACLYMVGLGNQMALSLTCGVLDGSCN
jgi:hypothetical protein